MYALITTIYEHSSSSFCCCYVDGSVRRGTRTPSQHSEAIWSIERHVYDVVNRILLLVNITELVGSSCCIT